MYVYKLWGFVFKSERERALIPCNARTTHNVCQHIGKQNTLLVHYVILEEFPL